MLVRRHRFYGRQAAINTNRSAWACAAELFTASMCRRCIGRMEVLEDGLNEALNPLLYAEMS